MLFLKYLDDLEHEKALKAELGGKSYAFIIDKPHRWSSWAAPKKADGSFDHDKALTGDDLIAYVNDELFPYLKGFKQRATGPDSKPKSKTWVMRAGMAASITRRVRSFAP
jgi:type I restriction enzyme M protein